MNPRVISRLLLASITVLAVALRPCLGAEEGTIPEYQAKAAFLYHFVQLTTWPNTAFASTNAPLTVAVVGSDSVGKDMAQVLKGKSYQGHPLVVARLERVDEVKDCQVLFVADSSVSQPADIVGQLGRRPVLTVGEGEGFIDQGGMIRLLKCGENIRFEINHAAALREGLKLSSKLLRLAVRVIPPKTGEP